MLGEELKYINLSGEKLPIKCDLLVLEKIQDKYGTVDNFEEKIYPWKKVEKENKETGYEVKMPEDIAALGDGLYWMVNEGEQIAVEKEGRACREYTREELLRKNDLSIFTLAVKIHREFTRCFEIKKEKTTQD